MKKRTQYLVTKVEPCPECGSRGWVRNWQWQELDAKYPDGCNEAQMAEHFNTSNSARWPDEESVCPECEGEKRIVSQFDLIDALKELGIVPA